MKYSQGDKKVTQELRPCRDPKFIFFARVRYGMLEGFITNMFMYNKGRWELKKWLASGHF